MLPKSLSGSGPIPCQGLEEDSCSMWGNNQNYSMGISSTSYSGTCPLTPCDKPDFSARIYMRDENRIWEVSKLVISTLTANPEWIPGKFED